MSNHTHAFAHWPFPDPANTATFCTDKVARQGFPVLQVAHDADGDWQFLDATSDDPGEPVLQCLGCVFERDATLAEIADLPRGWGAFRPRAGAAWERWEKEPELDELEQKALDDVEAYGLHIIHVMDEDGLPPFSYSIGVEKSLGLPDLIVVGLRQEVAHSVINECYRQMRGGANLAPGMRVSGLIDGFECVIGTVAPIRAWETMGWAHWLYQDAPFRAYQIIYPSTSSVFPWESHADQRFRDWQPLLDAAETPA